jgi:endo-1,4-beta-D-glucanase Y
VNGVRARYLILMLGLLLYAATSEAASSVCESWPAWQIYKSHFLDGARVVDIESERKITTSEGQSYGLLFALVANDRAGFDKILEWTENNLAQGDFIHHLPAWHWGRRDDGSWGVIDSNSAADSDLWIAYTLAQAGRLWNERRYRVLSKLIAHRILHEETVRIPGLGLSLLPAPVGFTPAANVWRLNPSYVPIQLLRGMAVSDALSPWTELIEPSMRLLQDSAPAGFAPDWVLYEAGKGFTPDVDTQGIGSYNAIRVYLWAGMLHPDEPLRRSLLDSFKPMAQHTANTGLPPEIVNTQTGAGDSRGPAGFSGALLPFLSAQGERQALDQQRQRLLTDPAPMTAYYNQSLTLFGLGWLEGYYRFNKDGSLRPRWSKPCTR